mmetsp:Transcript_5528/g.15994  ORF Transcript_5528/g.15994 Transcript_5528/m.15994 type:complete len:305 (-) Transcript_5528:79-993(-)
MRRRSGWRSQPSCSGPCPASCCAGASGPWPQSSRRSPSWRGRGPRMRTRARSHALGLTPSACQPSLRCRTNSASSSARALGTSRKTRPGSPRSLTSSFTRLPCCSTGSSRLTWQWGSHTSCRSWHWTRRARSWRSRRGPGRPWCSRRGPSRSTPCCSGAAAAAASRTTPWRRSSTSLALISSQAQRSCWGYPTSGWRSTVPLHCSRARRLVFMAPTRGHSAEPRRRSAWAFSSPPAASRTSSRAPSPCRCRRRRSAPMRPRALSRPSARHCLAGPQVSRQGWTSRSSWSWTTRTRQYPSPPATT